MRDAEALKNRELTLQRAVLVWILTGLAFMLLPGTFLGVWNLISIGGSHSAGAVSPAWIQAHGHAQIFGWLGSFILGIGFYSLGKMAKLGSSPGSRIWLSWALWTAGVSLRWLANVYGWQWRVLLPVSALAELAAFLVFFATISGAHGREDAAPIWVRLVVASMMGFLASLVANLALSVHSAIAGAGPEVAHSLDQRILALYTWGFPVLAVWGFNARWLPVFLGLPNPREALLFAALAVDVAAVAAALAGQLLLFTCLAAAAAVTAASALRVFSPAVNKPKTLGVHRSFPAFVRIAYVWLITAAAISIAAALADRSGGLWGASRHALTVGFLATMVFAIGQRVLPAFCGMHVLFSPRLMGISLFALNAGCLLRVVSEIGAYEGIAPALWPLLPVSAVTELAAVTVFAANLIRTFDLVSSGSRMYRRWRLQRPRGTDSHCAYRS